MEDNWLIIRMKIFALYKISAVNTLLIHKNLPVVGIDWPIVASQPVGWIEPFRWFY